MLSGKFGVFPHDIHKLLSLHDKSRNFFNYFSEFRPSIAHRYISTTTNGRFIENEHTEIGLGRAVADAENGSERDKRPNPRKGKVVGPKRPFKAGDVWEIRQYLKIKGRTRDLALFNLGIDSKLRACDLLDLRVPDIGTVDVIFPQATVVQKKTEAAVTFEITDTTKESVLAWTRTAGLGPIDYLWTSRNSGSPRLSLRQYSRIIKQFARVGGLTHRHTQLTRFGEQR